MILRSQASIFGGLLAFVLLACSTNCHAGQDQSKPRNPSIPTLEALPTSSAPARRFQRLVRIERQNPRRGRARDRDL
jgi:hypothetical protein